MDVALRELMNALQGEGSGGDGGAGREAAPAALRFPGSSWEEGNPRIVLLFCFILFVANKGLMLLHRSDL